MKECLKPEYRGKGLCVMHWRRLQRNGSPLVTRPMGVRPFCGLDGCWAEHYAKGWCQRHYMQERRGVPVTLTAAPPTYSGAHKRVRYVKGPASDHDCVSCGSHALDWAYDHTDPDELVGSNGRTMCGYSTDPGHYVPMCRRCHRAFDRNLSDAAALRKNDANTVYM